MKGYRKFHVVRHERICFSNVYAQKFGRVPLLPRAATAASRNTRVKSFDTLDKARDFLAFIGGAHYIQFPKWALRIVPVIAFLFVAQPSHAVEFEPFVKYTHTSDLLTGPPFASTAVLEPTTDYIGFGVTAVWKKFEIDLSHGRKARDCQYTSDGPCDWVSGTEVSFRWYPWKK